MSERTPAGLAQTPANDAFDANWLSSWLASHTDGFSGPLKSLFSTIVNMVPRTATASSSVVLTTPSTSRHEFFTES